MKNLTPLEKQERLMRGLLKHQADIKRARDERPTGDPKQKKKKKRCSHCKEQFPSRTSAKKHRAECPIRLQNMLRDKPPEMPETI